MNLLRNKLRAWLGIEFSMQCPNCELVCHSVKELQNHSCLWRCPTCHIFHQRSFDCTAAKQLEQQQREICALRGEVAMLKADREAERPVSVPGPTNWERYAVPVNAGEVWLTDHNWAENRRP